MAARKEGLANASSSDSGAQDTEAAEDAKGVEGVNSVLWLCALGALPIFIEDRLGDVQVSKIEDYTAELGRRQERGSMCLYCIEHY